VARSLQGVVHAAGRGDVVVLDQDGIVEAHAVVGDATGGAAAFSRGAGGRGLAGIEDLATRGLDGLRE